MKRESIKVAIDTLGCKVNQFDSALLEDQFLKEKLEVVSSSDPADIYIVNSCTVTEKADQEAKYLFRKFRKKNIKGKMLLSGCFAQTGKDFSDIEGLDIVVGNTLKHKIVEIVKELAGFTPPRVSLCLSAGVNPDSSVPILRENSFLKTTFDEGMIERATEKTRFFLKIQDGCDDFCTFCIIPYARGKSRSMPLQAVIEQINMLVQKGVKEIVLTGVSLGSYGWDLSPKTTLASVVKAIDSQTDLLRLRISSLEPEDVSEDLLEACQSSKKFCPHFHLPIQSGDDEILKKMRRNYTVSHYEDLVTRIQNSFKDVFIGIDVICGFPGEDQARFKNTYETLRGLPWSQLHVFPYSPRTGTAAAKFSNQIERSEILKRSKILRTLSEVRYHEFLKAGLNKTHQALVEKQPSSYEGYQKAISRNYLPILFKSDTAFHNQEVKLEGHLIMDQELVGKPI